MLKLGERSLNRLHFVGIGGAGMSAIALVAMELGVEVTGSDITPSENTERVEARGARVTLCHRAGNVGEIDAVVVSSAIDADNPEVAEARRRGIPVLHRSEMLAVLMGQKKGIAISGTHGKTTTTSMAALVFQRAGLAPTWIVGGIVRDLGSGAGYGEGDYLIAEADESDESFLRLGPLVAVATNIDNDHLEHYGTLERIVTAFETFLGRTRPGGFAVVCLDDPQLARISRGLKNRLVTYSARDGQAGAAGQGEAGTPGATHYQAQNVVFQGWGSRFEVLRAGKPLGSFSLGVPGRHNVSNATAVIAVATELGLDPAAVARGLAEFSGAGRRLQRTGRAGGVDVVDDYAHHPTEIATTLRAMRDLVAGQGRIIVVFQPHRYTRTRDLYREFGQAFADADAVVLTDIYSATERPIPGVSGELIYRSFARRPGQDVAYVPRLGDVAAYLAPRVRPGDVVLTMGAGNVRQAGPELLSLLAGQAAGAEPLAQPNRREAAAGEDSAGRTG